MVFADLNGDGHDELITGKRYFAHNGRDPGGKEPPCLYYYTWDPQAEKFERHVIDEVRVGTGLQIVVEDLNGDCKIRHRGRRQKRHLLVDPAAELGK